MMKVFLQSTEVSGAPQRGGRKLRLHMEATCVWVNTGQILTNNSIQQLYCRALSIRLHACRDCLLRRQRTPQKRAQGAISLRTIEMMRAKMADELLFANKGTQLWQTAQGPCHCPGVRCRKQKSSEIKHKSNSFHWAWRAQLLCTKCGKYFFHSASPRP